MLKTFFFIPSDKEKFVIKVSSIDADYFVFDLEDAVAKNEVKACLERLNRLELHDNYYVRYFLAWDHSYQGKILH